MNEFGDERKLKLEGLLDPETAETAARIILDAEPIVLGITFWNCFRPWDVPERRICDNFFFLTVSGGPDHRTRTIRTGIPMQTY